VSNGLYRCGEVHPRVNLFQQVEIRARPTPKLPANEVRRARALERQIPGSHEQVESVWRIGAPIMPEPIALPDGTAGWHGPLLILPRIGERAQRFLGLRNFRRSEALRPEQLGLLGTWISPANYGCPCIAFILSRQVQVFPPALLQHVPREII